MNRPLFLGGALAFAVSSAFGQVPPDPYSAAATPAPVAAKSAIPTAAVPVGDIKIQLADGTVKTASAIRRTRDTLLATIALAAGVKGEVGIPIANVRGIEMPEPPQLKTGRELLAAGKSVDALAQANIALGVHGPIRTIKGNWWAPVALLKVQALLALKRDREADAIITELAAGTTDPELLQSARMALAVLWLRTGRTDEAITVFDESIASSKKPSTLARAWQNKGDALLAKRDFDGALLAYLRVPVFYASEPAVQPAALLGRARAFEGLGDLQQANDALAELNQKFANAPEAALARTDAARIAKKRDPDADPAAETPATP